MARRSQCSDAGDNPLDPNYLPPHYREEYRLAIDALIEENVEGYYKFLQYVDVVDFLSPSEIDYIQNSVQLPKQSSHTEPRYLDTGGDGSSDTYWPLHSDLDAPGLDLGWPQIHHFIGPTEVTTLVNPAAPDMPSIKEQARRLIKNAQMVIAVVMDMFTDVDIFADILNAAMRNVAVYLLLDEANVDHFINMVNNCRVNLQNIPYLRVRTVTGIRYHCRTGKSFKGQMLDRFILTDCRAVLSGNYSFMWSYEKLHRCMAHLFLGQLVSTFDEEFRILFAQSEPLVIENMEEMTILPKRPLPGERPILGDTRKYRTMDTGNQEEWNRPPYEENMDWRMKPIKRQETFHGPLDIYNRYPSPQTRLDPQFDQGPPRLMDSFANKRHSFAEGGPGRYNLPYQQGLPDVEQPGRPYYRGQQPHHPRDEPDYAGYGQMDKFWNQEEPYSEPGYPRDAEPHEGYDPVHNYLSSTRNVDTDQSSDKLVPGPDLPYSTTHPRRHNVGQAYACQTSPTPSSTTEKKFMQEHSSDRKDPTVKRGLRNWRISSYLSAYDSSSEPEGLPMGQGQTVDPFDDMPNPMQQPTPPPPAVEELRVPKIPNVREFKVPALPRASQMPAYAKNVSKRYPDEAPQMTLPALDLPEPRVVTPTPSESSSTTDGEKQEEPEQREPITSTLRREDSFRRKYNAAAVQRSSRLRSSLIFSSLDQNTNQDNTESEDDKTKGEADQTKLPFVSQVLAQRRSGTREPLDWRNYIKSTDNAKLEEDSNKQGEKDSESKLQSNKESEDAAKSEVAKSKDVKTKHAAMSPELVPKIEKALPKPSQMEQPNIEPQPAPAIQPPTKSLLNQPFVDMDDPDQRFLFFKELAAQRKAAKAAEEAKLKQKAATKAKTDEKKEEKEQKDVVGTISSKPAEDSKKSDAKTLSLSSKTDLLETSDKKLSTAPQSCEKLETEVARKDKKDELNKQVKPQKDVVSLSTVKPKEDSKKTDAKNLNLDAKISTNDQSVKTEPKAMQSSQKTATKVTADSGKIEAKQSKVSQPQSTDKLIQEKQTSTETAASKAHQKTDKPSEANVVGTQAPVETVTKETQPADNTDATSIDSPLKTSRSVPDFLKTGVSDLLSSLPSSRIFERSLSLEANKDTTPKSRLWSPSLHRIEFLKAFGEKSKSISTVGQIEEEASQTEPSKSEEISSDKTRTEENKDSKVETQSVTESVASGTEVTKHGKEAVSSVDSLKKSSVLPSIPETPSASPAKTMPQSENILANSTTSAIQVKADSKDSPQSVLSEKSTTKEKTEALGKESASEESKKPTQDKTTTLVSISDQNLGSFGKSGGGTEVKDSENPSPFQSIVGKSTTDQPKTDKVQPTEMKKSSDVQVNTSVQQPEKSNVVTKKVCSEEGAKTAEKAEKLASTTEKSSGESAPTGKHSTGRLTSIDKTNIPSQEKVELTTDPSSSKDPKIPSTTLPCDKTEESLVTHPKFLITTEDFAPFESHSNTSSPASFATALEFITSEDSDMLSPAKADPQHLFKTVNTESSVSDMSDFGTPNSDISLSPMPFAVSTDDTAGDNVSIAETVIEAASRRKSEITEERKVNGDGSVPMQESQKGLAKVSGQIESLQERTENLDVSEAGKLEDNARSGGSITAMDTVCPAGSPDKKEAKTADKVTSITTESSIKEKSGSTIKGSKDVQSEFISTNVKTQDLTSQSETNAQLTKEKTASPTTSEETKTTKDESKESTDVKSTDAKVSTTNSESETKLGSTGTSPTNQLTTSLASDVKNEATSVADVSEIANKEPTKPRTVSSRFLSEPTSSAKTPASVVTPNVTKEEKKADTVSGIESYLSESKTEEGIEVIEEKGKDLEPLETKVNQHLDKSTEVNTKEASAASENGVSSKGDKCESKTEEAKITGLACEVTDKESHKDVSKVVSSTSPATSEDTKVLLEESQEKSTDDQSEHKSKDTIENTKDLKQNETAPTTAQPKQQPKPPSSRYLSSTANVISSSNLRDDTKILLEQISAQSQSRNESAKEAPVTDDEKEDEADKNAKRKKENELRSSLGQPKTSQEREKVLERIQTMRKDRKVYSRFEL